MKSHVPWSSEASGQRPPSTPKLDRILVPTDLSRLSNGGIATALSLLEGNPDASLTLVHVIEPLPAVGFLGNGELADAAMARLVDSAKDELLRLSQDHGNGIPLRTEAVVGNPARIISEMASEGAFDLVVMTSHGRTGFQRAFLGSVAEGILHRAHCSVLVVKPAKSEGGEFVTNTRKPAFENILVGYDHRQGSVLALGVAVKISERNHAAITLMHALSPPDARLVTEVLYDENEHAASISEALAGLEGVRLSYSPLSAGWNVAVGNGAPWDALAKRAEDAACDLIVVGPHGHVHRARDFIASTAQRLVRLSSCSVLSVR